MFKKTAPIAAALLGLALTATPSLAKDVEVRYGDLDLTSAQGQKTLEVRLRKAAREACDYDTRTTGSMLPSHEARDCYIKATQKAQGQMAAAIENAEQYNRLGG